MKSSKKRKSKRNITEKHRGNTKKLIGGAKFTLQNGDLYEGDFEDGKIHGNGKMTFQNGNVYVGEWANNAISGIGVMTYANGAVYHGIWKNSCYNGEGKMTYTDGAVYYGDWVNDKKHGKGVMTYANGAVYDGEWENDRHDGDGKMTYVGDPKYAVFRGHWKNDKKNRGEMKYTNGDVYDGEWKENMHDGEGVMVYKDGTVYTGGWKDNVCNGFGKLVFPNGGSSEGNFKDDEMDGEGKMIFADGGSYTGSLKRGDMDGYGILIYPSGDTYTGQFYQGFIHGLGEMIISSSYFGDIWIGTVYKGMWNDDKQHGIGTMTFSDGRTFKGLWRYGVPTFNLEEYEYQLTGNWEGITWFDLGPRPLPQGVAYEVHNAAYTMFAGGFWNSFYGVIAGKPGDELYIPDDFYTNMSTVEMRNYVEPQFVEWINQNDTDYKIEDKAIKTQELSQIFNKLLLAFEICNNPDHKIMMGRSIDWVKKQKPYFVDLYVSLFIEDNIRAYEFNQNHPLADRISCPKGIVERFVMTINNTIESLFVSAGALSSDNQIILEEYNKKFQDTPYFTLFNIFKHITYPINNNFNSHLKQEWAEGGWKKIMNEGDVSWGHMNPEEKKQNYIKYMIFKYEEAGIDYIGLEADIVAEINDSNMYNYIFEREDDDAPTFGGRRYSRQRKKEKKRKKKVTHKLIKKYKK